MEHPPRAQQYLLALLLHTQPRLGFQSCLYTWASCSFSPDVWGWSCVLPSCMRAKACATGQQCIPLSWAAPLLNEPCKAITAENSDPRQQSQGISHVSNLINSTFQAERPDWQSSPLGFLLPPGTALLPLISEPESNFFFLQHQDQTSK